ncbi:tunicamycin resistance protein [Naganishia albida]|nr:tunicamycin resistance protein [Naganishia albida]
MTSKPPPIPPRTLPLLVPLLLAPSATSLILHPLLSAARKSPTLDLPILRHIPLPPPTAFPALEACVGFSILAFLAAVYAVPALGDAFMDKGLKGRDLLKGAKGQYIPESMGLPCAAIYLACLMVFIPFPFSHYFEASLANTPLLGSDQGKVGESVGTRTFPLQELTLYLSALLSLMTATLLGFLDDIFDIRWRHKLPIPLISSIPLLLVYYAESGLTTVVMPRPVRAYLGQTVDLGWMYYAFMALLSTFATNSINILAGVNGLEVGQALVIALSVMVNDLLYIPVWPRVALGDWVLLEGGAILQRGSRELVQRHLLSLYFMGPLIGVCAGFIFHNWYPARAFPGDTLCYFTGMALAVVAIQAHYSKTLLLFFIPQIFNFLLSCPQLFGFVPCPRHRVPTYDEPTDKLLPSVVLFPAPPPLRTRAMLRLLAALRLTRLTEDPAMGTITSATNLTLPTVILVHLGPMREPTLTKCVMALQVAGSAVALAVRYGLASLLYDGDRK